MANFSHLNVHSGYSILEGLSSPKEIIKKAKEYNMHSVAITDMSNMFATIEFYKEAKKEGIKPIIGAEVNILPKIERNEKGIINTDNFYKSTLLAKNNDGYRYLMEILSKANIDGLNDEKRHNTPYIEESYIAERASGLIMLSGGVEGKAGKLILEGKFEEAKEAMMFWKKVFGDRYINEITRTGRKIEEDYIPNIVNFSLEKDIPIVATNCVKFLEKDDFIVHETRVCIQKNETLESRGHNTPYSPHQYFKTTEEMEEIFEDIPEALTNTQAIVNSCNVELKLNHPSLPLFPLPTGTTESKYLRKISEEGLNKRLKIITKKMGEEKAKQKEKEYKERLDTELEVIDKMGFPGYFLIVADFIQWSKRNDIPVGPGRGSGAGSLVAYSCEITDIDPIPYDLLFERFLNPERVSMPDFDIDFCEIGREKVVNYVSHRYGSEAVSLISTFGTMAARSSVKDSARVLGHNYSFGDRLSKMIPNTPGIKLRDAINQVDILKNEYDQKPEVKKMLDVALRLEGAPRSVGRHAAGVLISPSKLSDFTPIHNNGENFASQYSKDDVETAGLVKFDFLGLSNLTIVDDAVKSINRRKEFNKEDLLNISLIPMDDKKTFDLLKSGNSTAVFQLESSGMKGLMKKMRPDSFEDIIALVALYRPGPLQSGMVDDFVQRKHGEKRVEYPHPSLEKVLKPTYGVIVYQEQVMQIAQELAGYSLGQADLLRRAMGKKKPEEMAKQKNFFIQGAKENGVEEEKATEIFELIDYFSGYGFNKSHSAAYALIAYQTAYLKAHYPVEFMSAVMSNNMKDSDKIVNFINDITKDGHKILPPNINKSGKQFLPTNKGNIIFGLNAIKGVGEKASQNIIEEREKGQYKDILDFIKRTNSSVNKIAIEGLVNSGAFDSFNYTRSQILSNIRNLTEYRKKFKDLEKEGKDTKSIEQPDFNSYENISHKEMLDNEAKSLGIYISGHPFDEYKKEVESIVTAKNNEIDLEKHGYKETDKKMFMQVGVITGFNKRKQLTSFTLDDTNGVINCIMFKNISKKYQERINNGEVIGVKGRLVYDKYSDSESINVSEIFSMQEIREKYSGQFVIKGKSEKINNQELMNEIKKDSENHSPGYCKFIVINQDSNEIIKTDMSSTIVPNEAFIESVKNKGFHAEILYKGNLLKIKDIEAEENKTTRFTSEEDLVHNMKTSLKRLKSLIDEAQLEKKDQVRTNIIKRSRDTKLSR